MGNGSMLPPDVRAEMQRGRARMGGGGIGGGAAENAVSAKARDFAVDPNGQGDDQDEAAASAAPREELKVCPNPRCTTKLEDAWTYCARCGADLIRGGAAKKLGIELTEEDLQSYIFRGYVIREIAFLGKHKVMVRSSIADDADKIDNFLMNGDWRKSKEKDKDSSPRSVSDFFFKQMQQLAVTAACIHKIDGQSIGEDLEARVKYLQERGAAMADMLGTRAVLFNQAVTEYLMRADSLSGS